MSAPTTTGPATFDLGPTASYARRRATWFPGRGAACDDRLGTLRLICQRGGHPGDSDSVDEYGVVEETEFPLRANGWRVFLLLNDSDASQDDVYRVLVGPAGASCTCRAARCGLGCKHGAALARLVAEGVI